MSKKVEMWEPCPRCGSKKVNAQGGCFFFLLGFALLGVSIWLILLVPPVGVAGILLGIGFMFASPFLKNMLQCQDCKKAWKFPHKTKHKEGV
ncbi:hypothetical protein [Desulfofalx alkaliphila]|uniref:hypothetical protein n=1 Tax=Desulfofalx alkaliphila TaxID=105483 RepID=UPI0004E181D3|nr:hypothetical protein [Desulfofalx alkaliphila]